LNKLTDGSATPQLIVATIMNRCNITLADGFVAGGEEVAIGFAACALLALERNTRSLVIVLGIWGKGWILLTYA